MVDESGVNHAMGRSHAWVKRGEEYVEPRPMNWGDNLTLIGAMRCDRLLVVSTQWDAVNAENFVRWVRRRLAPRLRPGDVVVMDIAMPELNGLDATARIARGDHACPVLILSMHATEQYVLEALRNGASGYVLKDADADELERAIHCVVRGEKYLTPAVSKHVLDDYMRRIRSDEAQEATTTRTLTARQREILQLIAEGKSTREIAERLHLSVKTVETHRAVSMRKLKVHSTAELVRYAVRSRLIQP